MTLALALDTSSVEAARVVGVTGTGFLAVLAVLTLQHGAEPGNYRHGVIARSIDWNIRYNGRDVDDDTDVIIGRAERRVLAIVHDSLAIDWRDSDAVEGFKHVTSLDGDPHFRDQWPPSGT